MGAVGILKESLRLAAEIRLTTCIWGHRGIGKSKIVHQLAQVGDGETIEIYSDTHLPVDCGIQRGDVESSTKTISLPIGLIDYRCSQIESSDIRGLPDKDGGRTSYLPPFDLPIADMTAAEIYTTLAQVEDPDEKFILGEKLQPHYKRGILFLDEINRAQDDVLQAVFQLLLDLKVGQYVLPPGWRILVACNFMEGDYITNGFNDAALLDRMCHLTFTAGEGTLEDWSKYMADGYGPYASSAIEFCASNTDYLVGKVSGQLGFTIQPSPRSWERVVEIEKLCANESFSEEAKFNVISGLVGQAAAIAYREYSCPVKPRDILEKGVEPFRAKLDKLERSELLSITWGMVALSRDKLDDERVIDICLDLAEVLLNAKNVSDKDVIVGFCRALMEDGDDDLTACLTNRELAASLLEFYKDASLIVKRLYERKALHSKLSLVGWGNA